MSTTLFSRPSSVLTTTLLLLLLPPMSHAVPKGDGPFPKGCRAQGYEFSNNHIILSPTNEAETKQSLYLIYNRSNQSLTLRAHEKQYELLGMDWKMSLEPHTWSSFAINKEHLEFTCEAGEQSTDCEMAISLCEYNRAVFGDAIYGSYWVVTNKPLSIIVERSIKNGILLRW